MAKRNIFVLVGLFFLMGLIAQEENKSSVSVDNGLDFVSGYVFRGVVFDYNPHVQGWMSFTKGNFTFGLWGTSNLQGTYVETNFYASYAINNFNILVTDYNAGLGQNYFDFDEKTTLHTLDLTLSYSLSGNLPLSFELSTLFYGYDPTVEGYTPNGDLISDGNKNYSTYFGIGYPLKFNETSVDLSLGMMLNESYWYGTDKASFTNIGVKTSKNFQLSESFSFTGFFQLATNPSADQALVVVGINF